MTPAETQIVQTVQTAQFSPGKGAVTPKGTDPGPQGPDVHPEDAPQVNWVDKPVNQSPSGNVSVAKHNLAPEPQPQVPGTEPQLGTEAKPEGAAPEPEVKPQPRSNDAKRFAALAKEEKKLARERNELRAMRQELENGLAEVRQFNQLRQTAKQDPLRAVREGLGLEYEDLTSAVLNDGKPAPETQIKALKEELDEFKAETAAERDTRIKAQKSRLINEEKQTLNQFYGDVKDFVTTNAQTYEYVNLFDAANLVGQVIELNFQKTKKIMSYEEAAQMTDDYLMREFVEKGTATQKWKSRSEGSPEPKQERKPVVSASGAKTLSNQMTVSSRPAVSNGKRSDDQRLREAIAALQTTKA